MPMFPMILSKMQSERVCSMLVGVGVCWSENLYNLFYRVDFFLNNKC